MRKFVGLLLLAVLFGVTTGCSTDFDVNAAPKEIRSVYCVLNPKDSVQYVRVAKAYQVEGDALAYAGANDFSVTGLLVKLTGNGKTWTAQEVPNFPKGPGTFLPLHTVYQFTTDGSGAGHDTLAVNNLYTLEVSTPDAVDYVKGETFISEIPRIRGDLGLVPGAGNSLCLPKIFLDRDYHVIWRKLGDGINYELRVGFNYEANGVPHNYVWGPTNLDDGNKGCNEGVTSICYGFSDKNLLRTFLAQMPVTPLVQYTYNTHDSCVANPSLVANLPKSLWFEVTAVDQYLSNYMIVNDPKVQDLNGSKPEYTNLTGNIESVGVFGSYNTDRRYAYLSECAAALLGLNGIVATPGCVWE